MSALLLAFAGIAVFGNQTRDIKLGDEIVQIVAGLQDHVAAPAAIAAIGTALGDKGLAAKGHATGATVAGAGVDFHLINEHDAIIGAATKKARPEPRP